MKLKKAFYIGVGCVCVALGALGATVPLIPSVPFLLLAAICFARSSQRLHTWFVGTKLYKNNLESYVQGKGMTVRTKIRIMTIVTITMAIGFIMMGNVPIGRIVLAMVWVLHLLYFVFGIRTIPATKQKLPDAE